MEAWLLPSAIVVGMFIVRLGVPLAITLAIAYFLRRLDAKWKAEAQAKLGITPAPAVMLDLDDEYDEWEEDEPIEAQPRPVMNQEAAKVRS